MYIAYKQTSASRRDDADERRTCDMRKYIRDAAPSSWRPIPLDGLYK